MVLPVPPVVDPSARESRRRRSLVASVVVLALVCAVLGGFALLRPGASGSPVAGSDPAPSRPGPDDGYIAQGDSVSPFDESLPAISRLDPGLRSAVQQAAHAAKVDGYTFVITSGWRSHGYQKWLLDQAVRDVGEKAARARVAMPGTSAHETGAAVDIGYTDADSWMMQHGSDYGLCQIYTNEMWHYERATTPGGECPPQYAGAESR